jgi:CubicO group peptidase (beta-lactamase class C family)
VQPTTFFRQASVSKLFTAAAIYQLIDEGAIVPGTSTALTLHTLLKDALPNIANGPAILHWNDITIQHLLEMTSGVTSGILGTDPAVSSTLPVSALQMAEWLYRQTVTNTPGDTTKGTYSNAGYMLLGLIVARMRGASDFVSALATFLNKLNITRVRSAVSGPSAPADEARYHSRPLTTEPSVIAPSVSITGQPLCALGYGGWNLENCGGGGGLSAAATDVARVLAALSVTLNNPMMSAGMLQTWLNNAANATATITGPDAHGYHGFDSVWVDGTSHQFMGLKGGSLETSQNGVLFNLHGISVVMCWNGMTPSNPQWFSWDTDSSDPNRSVVMSAVVAQDWSGVADLFPTFGMPSFPVLKPLPIPIPRPFPPRVFSMPSHMLPQKGPRKNM